MLKVAKWQETNRSWFKSPRLKKQTPTSLLVSCLNVEAESRGEDGYPRRASRGVDKPKQLESSPKAPWQLRDPD